MFFRCRQSLSFVSVVSMKTLKQHVRVKISTLTIPLAPYLHDHRNFLLKLKIDIKNYSILLIYDLLLGAPVSVLKFSAYYYRFLIACRSFSRVANLQVKTLKE